MKRVLVVLCCAFSWACGPNPDPLDPNIPPVTEGTWYQPATSTTWQWQLQGAINTAYDADVYDIDLFDVSTDVIDTLHTDGRIVMCYFSAGSWERFRDDANDFPKYTRGKKLDGYADERWLDIRFPEVHALMRKRLDLAVNKGCDAVEPDNMQGYLEDTGHDFTQTDQLAYNRIIANEARMRGLGVALKNDLDQIPDLLDYFDLAVNEQCFEYDECDPLDAFVGAGKAVLGAEYSNLFVDNPTQRDTMCQAALSRDFRVLVLPVDLNDAFRYSCDAP